jgi:hypothetical protein
MKITLQSAWEDTLRVYADAELIGEIAPSCDGWAAYRATDAGFIVEERVGTYPTIATALEALL